MRPPVTVAQLGAIDLNLTDTEIVAAVERLLWPLGPVCVKCGAVNNAYRISRPNSHWAAVYRCADRNCRASFSTKMGTIFQGATNLSWRQIIRVCKLYSKKRAPTKGDVALAAGMSVSGATNRFKRMPEAVLKGTIWDEAALDLMAERGAADLRTVRRQRELRDLAMSGLVEEAHALTREGLVGGLVCKCGGKEFYTLHAESRKAGRPTFRCKACKRDIRYRGPKEGVGGVASQEPERQVAPRTEMYWDKMRREKKARAAALTREQKKQVAKIDADARIEKDKVVNPDDYFLPEETSRRFDALLTAALHTKPVTQQQLVEMNRRGELPRIEEMTTEEMEAVAEEKKRTALEERFVVLTGKDGGPLSDVMQAAARARGWMVTPTRHALMPRLASPDQQWRRFGQVAQLAAVAARPETGDTVNQIAAHLRDAASRAEQRNLRAAQATLRKRMTPEEEAALAAYRGAIKEVAAPTDKRKGPRPPSEKREKSLEAVQLCITLGFSPDEAADRTPGASPHLVRNLLHEMRAAGKDTGLADEAKYRAWSGGQSRRRFGDD